METGGHPEDTAYWQLDEETDEVTTLESYTDWY